MDRQAYWTMRARPGATATMRHWLHPSSTTASAASGDYTATGAWIPRPSAREYPTSTLLASLAPSFSRRAYTVQAGLQLATAAMSSRSILARRAVRRIKFAKYQSIAGRDIKVCSETFIKEPFWRLRESSAPRARRKRSATSSGARGFEPHSTRDFFIAQNMDLNIQR